MRSTGEDAEGCNSKRKPGHRDSGTSPIEEPRWEMVGASSTGGVSEIFAPAIRRLCNAIEKEIKNVGKN